MSATDRPVISIINYDENENQLHYPLSGSVFPSASGLTPIGAKTTNGLIKPLLMTSGSSALAVTQTSCRPLTGEYNVATGLINGSASAQNLFSIENPVGSNRFVIVRKLAVGGTAAAVANVAFIYRLGRNNTFPSNGTVLNITKRQTGDPNAVAIIRSSPNGSVTNDMWVGSPGSVMTAVGHLASNPPMLAIDAFNDEGDVILSPGEALIMIANNNDTDWRHFGFVRWQEST